MGQAEWVTVPISTRDVEGPMFFTPHEWDTIEAASARIIPTDHHPGAREARVVRFIDRMLAGTQFIFAAADGHGFLRMEGHEEQAWAERIEQRRAFYRDGVVQMDALAQERAGVDFVELDPEAQDAVLEHLSGVERPRPFLVAEKDEAGLGGAPAGNQPVNEDFLEFFPLLVLNTRQGFYGDPVYGGNENRVGWGVIGFDGPPSLASTMDGSYTTRKYMVEGAEWPYDQHPEVLRYRRS
ncbi:gluconate 2-dehydrogenase gamma chain [Microbacterium sp. cf046]|uniref:gluconate 2-dehydrogenase subunit 3 family protein n=1 Tax=Microbacterium sp. cf046 TaxID=1761803 RepID=UPI0008E23A7F|nr:gluconate 2-dehydrogenase subunit 3 family protein [Microbacterium sp. cf046]SFS17516.1 gluconate 2-dehydrogenase gamma chain [Microbacterium sp. cf046]